MYNARIETDAGKVFFFGYRHGSVFDIEPLGGVQVELGTSQGFALMGETVDVQSVRGMTRTVDGVFFGEKPEYLVRALFAALPARTSGRLYFNDDFCCDIVVKETPRIKKDRNGRVMFSLSLFCPLPFWLSVGTKRCGIGDMRAAFSFPVIYTSHRFGVRSDELTGIIENGGDVDVPVTVTFRASGSVSNISLTDAETGQFLGITGTLGAGDSVKIYGKAGRIHAQKESGGAVSDALSMISQGSSLFMLRPGENRLRLEADSGEANLSAFVSFGEAYMGIYPEKEKDERLALFAQWGGDTLFVENRYAQDAARTVDDCLYLESPVRCLADGETWVIAV